MKLSAIVITHNEAANIERCLRSLSFADERIVIDAESSDETVPKAQALKATVSIRLWPGFGKQKNEGLRQAQGEWVLFIDADEEVTDELRESILAAIQQRTRDFYWLTIVTIFLGRPLKHLYGHNLRLFRKSAGQWSDSAVHEQVLTKTGQQLRLRDELSAVLPEPLQHHSHATVAKYLTTMHHYTTLDAQEMLKTGHHRSGRKVVASWWLPWQLCLRQFLKLFFYRQGWRDGVAGWLWCVLSAYYEWEMAQKFRKAVRDPRSMKTKDGVTRGGAPDSAHGRSTGGVQAERQDPHL